MSRAMQLLLLPLQLCSAYYNVLVHIMTCLLGTFLEIRPFFFFLEPCLPTKALVKGTFQPLSVYLTALPHLVQGSGYSPLLIPLGAASGVLCPVLGQKDTDKLERVQWVVQEEAEGAGFFSLEKARLRGSNSSLLLLLQEVYSKKTKGKGHNVQQQKFQFNIRKIFHHKCGESTARVAQRGCVIWEVFKAQVDKVLSNLIHW